MEILIVEDHAGSREFLTELLSAEGYEVRAVDGGELALAEAFWEAGIEEVFIDGSFCTSKPDPGDIDGYWVEPDPEVYDRLNPYWIDFTLVPVPHLGKWRWRMWADHGVEFFIHPAMDAAPNVGFPEFFRKDREGYPRGVIQIVKAKEK